MEFIEKQFDGPYEVSSLEIEQDGEFCRGLLYYPPEEKYKKPYPLIILFHGFPQIFPLRDIIKSFSYLLDKGYALIAFDFRGYRSSDGTLCIQSHVEDGLNLLSFAQKMSEHSIFDINNFNIIANHFGAYIALIVASKSKIINKLLLLHPILDLERHVHNPDFQKMLHYLNRFLPNHVKGIDDVDGFIEKTKIELSDLIIEEILSSLNYKQLKIITGEFNKVTPVSEINKYMKDISSEIIIIEGMEHESFEDEEIEKVENEIKKIFDSPNSI